MSMHTFEYRLDCGILLDVEYRSPRQGWIIPEIVGAWASSNTFFVDLFNELNGDVQDAIEDAAISDWRKVSAEEKQCAAEAKADADREEMLMAADPRSHGPDIE